MPQSEWFGLFHSLLDGGVLTPAEAMGYAKAMKARGLVRPFKAL